MVCRISELGASKWTSEEHAGDGREAAPRLSMSSPWLGDPKAFKFLKWQPFGGVSRTSILVVPPKQSSQPLVHLPISQEYPSSRLSCPSSVIVKSTRQTCITRTSR